MKPNSKALLPYIVLTILAIIFISPLIWLVIASLDKNASQSLKIPEVWTLANYSAVLSDKGNLRGFAIGLYISLTQSFLVVIISLLAAYPLSRYELRYKKLFLYTILFMTSLPITTVMVPVYKLFLNLRLYDNLASVIIFFAASSLPYGIWLTKNFMDSIPIELEEAAWIDGATPLMSIKTVIAPLMVPGICVVGIFTFTMSWGNFFVPYILLQSVNNLPASIRLYQFFGNYGMVAYGQLAAYSALYAIPSIVLYILAQKYMSKGFALAGAAKG